MTLRVGMDARFASARYDGVGRYVAELAEALAVLPGGPDLSVLPPPPGDPPRHPLPAPPAVRLLRLRPAVRAESPLSHVLVPRMVRAAGLDVWHTPFPLAPFRNRVPSVVTLHDCIPDRFPAYFGAAKRAAYRLTVAAALRDARLVIAISAMTAEDARRFHGVPADRIRIVRLGVRPPAPPSDSGDDLARLGLEPGYVLLVGRPRPHKGFATVVRALAGVPAPGRPLLVRVGRHDPRLPDGSAGLAAESGVRLRVLEGLDEAELTAVYRGAGVVAIPSLVEGFGMPMLEALAAGAPVVASDIEPLRHSGGELARYVRGGPTAWADALLSAVADRAWLARARVDGPARAALFTWADAARGTAAVYEEAVA